MNTTTNPVELAYGVISLAEAIGWTDGLDHGTVVITHENYYELLSQAEALARWVIPQQDDGK